MAEGKYLPPAVDWNFPMQVSGLGTVPFIHCRLAEIHVTSASTEALTKALYLSLETFVL